jgi:hypothetical protein
MGLRGLFFLLGGTLCLLWQSPLVCIIAAVTMTGFNCKYINIYSILSTKKYKIKKI